MPIAAELYGQPLREKGMDTDVCRRAWCAFTDATCDGGGNRNMARISSSDPTLGHLFEPSVGRETGGSLPCGLCSVALSKQHTWAICPHRLFAFGPTGVSLRHHALARRVFRLGGFRPGERLSVWSEITLREQGSAGRLFNYRLDYVLRDEAATRPPVIVEVMTCSTSGGNKAMGTDIRTAFKRAVLFAHTPVRTPVQSPGVNVRQVWARMASQLVAKSEAANSWGGRTIWIVQDLLADYIRTKTALPLDEMRSPNWQPDEVNMLVATLRGPLALYSGPIRSPGSNRRCWLEILGAPHLPSIDAMTMRLNSKPPIATVTAF